MSTVEINWRQNCLTVGPHDGRPEALWNLSLIHAWMTFPEKYLQEIVVARIYNDAMQFVEHGEDPRPSQEWAEQVKQYANDWVLPTYQRKVEELNDYYKSSSWANDLRDVAERVKENKLNPGYQPLHGHDSINLLCRIVGVSASREASK